MTERQKLKLPSGREVELKPLGVAELYRVQGELPNLGSPDETPDLTQRETYTAGIKMILECVTKPRFWFDLRDDAQRNEKPIDCPDGREELDLSIADFWKLVIHIGDEIASVKESISPLSETPVP